MKPELIIGEKYYTPTNLEGGMRFERVYELLDKVDNKYLNRGVF